MIQYQDVSNAPYHEKQIDYYVKQVDDMSISAEQDPMIPLCTGSLAQKYDREGTKFTVEEWRRVAIGYNPFEEEWFNHPIRGNATKLGPDHKPLPEVKASVKLGKPLVNKLVDGLDSVKAADVLGQEKSQKKDRGSLEFVLSGDKSISVWWAAQDKQTQDRYTTQVNRILHEKIYPMLDRYSMYEKAGKKCFGSKLAFVTHFNHIESRGIDPFLHTHLNITNSVQCEDGTYRALVTDGITKNISLIDAVWQMETANMLRREFGLQLTATATKADNSNDHLEEHEKNVFTFAVAGVPQHLCKEYSKRSAEISAELKRLKIAGHDTYEAAALAQVSTRSQKTDLNSTQLREQWRSELSQKWNYDADAANKLAKAEQPALIPPTDIELLESFDRRVNEVETTEAAFKAHVYKQLMLIYPQDVIERRAEELFDKQALGLCKHGKEDLYEQVNTCTDPGERKALQDHLSLTATYTLRYFKEREDRTFEGFEQRKSETGFVIPKPIVLKALAEYQEAHSTPTKPFNFTAGQLEAAIATLTEPGAVSSVIGMAGTGKTSVVRAVKEIAEGAGYRVIGTATAAKAATGLLNESGIKTGGNTSELLMRLNGIDGKPPTLTLTKKDILILDEAGMTSGREICELAEHVNRAGAKLVCLGDPDQLQAVGSSGLYRHIASRFTCRKMTEIQRQNEDWAREMVSDAAAGRSFDSIIKLHTHGCIDITKTTAERVRAIASDYVADKSAPSNKFIVASVNADADMINNEVQRLQLERKELSIDMGVAVVEDRDGVTRKFHVGERIVFSKKTQNSDPNERNKANNSDTGVVKSIEHRKGAVRAITIELDGEPKKTLTLGPDTVRNLKLGSCLTTHKSQGATVKNSYLFGSSQLNNLHAFYVQLSRHKENTKLYLSEDMVETLAKNMKLAAPSPAQQSWARDLIEKSFESCEINEAEKKALYEKTETFQGCREYLNLNPEAWTADSSMSRQKLMEIKTLRDFVSIFEAYGKAQYKKATLDLNVLSEDHNVRLRESRQALKASSLNRTPLPTVQESQFTVAQNNHPPGPEGPKLSPLAQVVVKPKRVHAPTMH